jgi:hypothetical protein
LGGLNKKSKKGDGMNRDEAADLLRGAFKKGKTLDDVFGAIEAVRDNAREGGYDATAIVGDVNKTICARQQETC